ncbi:MAG: 50S ribosomal protein L18 [Candidatus Pacearchaeota archaeon]
MKNLIKVQFKRRRQFKTDYLARRRLLEAGKPRIVVRKTNRYIIIQLIESEEAQDRIICSTNSKELLKYGLQPTFSIKNLSAAYLTGYLCALKALKKGVKEAILDIGLNKSTKGSKIYASVKGAIDAGLNIKCAEKMFPEEERIKINKDILEEIKTKFKYG